MTINKTREIENELGICFFLLLDVGNLMNFIQPSHTSFLKIP
jgi:hypothetical protein